MLKSHYFVYESYSLIPHMSLAILYHPFTLFLDHICLYISFIFLLTWSHFSICVQYFLPLFKDQNFIVYFQVHIQISIDNEGRTLVFSFVKSFFLCMSKGRPDLTNFSKGMKPSPTQSWASEHFPNPSLKTLIWPRLPNMTLKVVGLWIWPMLSVLPIWAKFFRSKQTNFFPNGIKVQDTKFFNYI